jgi:hypothetical protein
MPVEEIDRKDPKMSPQPEIRTEHLYLGSASFADSPIGAIGSTVGKEHENRAES